jgi:CheY-like chemotaxis protein
MATKLLLADDSITIQKVVELVLSEEGFEIAAAGNGEDALNSVSSFKPDIVLADIEMPKMNGYQLCEKIKANPETRDIPVILLAGAFEPIDEELAKKVGANDYIIKPFESQDLISKINASLMMGVGAGEAEAAVVAEEEAPQEAAVSAAGEEDLWSMEEFAEAAPLEEAKAEEEVAIGEEVSFAEALEEEPSLEEAIAEEAGEFEEAVTEAVPWAAGETPVIEEEAITEREEFIAEAVPAAPEVKAPEARVVTPKIEVPKLEMPSKEQVAGMVKAEVSGKISELLRGLDLKETILLAITPYIRDTVETTLKEVAPKLVESCTKDMFGGIAESLKKDIEKVIWETVPDLAESIIKKEIDKIRSEL